LPSPICTDKLQLPQTKFAARRGNSRVHEENSRVDGLLKPFEAIAASGSGKQVFRQRHRQNSKRPKTLCGFPSCSFFFFHCGFTAAVLWPAHNFAVSTSFPLRLCLFMIYVVSPWSYKIPGLQARKEENMEEKTTCQSMQLSFGVVPELTFH